MSVVKIPKTGSIVILTGAGISQESGIDTFRCEGGIWSKVRLEDVATPEGFERDPDLVHRFYNDRRKGLKSPEIAPNPAHLALVRLEKEWAGDVLVITQNIDDLHERAGLNNVLHMHGELNKLRCERCGKTFAWFEDAFMETHCPMCGKSGGLRPHVVWFGELPHYMERIYRALSSCDLFISIGTSGNVYPAAGFVAQVRDNGGAETVELNLEPSEGAQLFDFGRYGPASQVVPKFIDELLT